MNCGQSMSENIVSQQAVAPWFLTIGTILILGTGALDVRLLYESTFLTWWDGPRNVGGGLMHGSDSAFVVLPMLYSMVLIHIWCLIFLFLLPYQLYRGRSFSRRAKVTFIAATIAILLLWVPYGWWRFLMLRIAGPGEHAASQLTYAAAFGELSNVRAILKSGVSVNATDEEEPQPSNAPCCMITCELSSSSWSPGRILISRETF